MYVQNSAAPIFTGNVINNNGYGVYVDGNFAGGPPAAPVFTGNQIYANAPNFAALRYSNATGLVLNVTGNWWGSTDASAISGSITDLSDDPNSPFNYPVVDYSGYLLSATGPAVTGNFLNGPLTATTTTLTAGTVYDVLGVVSVGAGKTPHYPGGRDAAFPRPGIPPRGWNAQRAGHEQRPGHADVGALEPGARQLGRHRAARRRLDHRLRLDRMGLERRELRWRAGRGEQRPPSAISAAMACAVSGSGTPAQITGNLIDNLNRQATCIYTNGASPVIQNTTMRNCQYGMYVQNSSSPTVTGSVINNNGYGVWPSTGISRAARLRRRCSPATSSLAIRPTSPRPVMRTPPASC